MPYTGHYIKGNAFAEWLGTGRKDAYKNANLSLTDINKLGLELGQYGWYDGHLYRAVLAQSAITGEGYIVKTYANNAARTGTATAASTKAKLVTADTFTKAELKGGRIWIPSGTGSTQTQRVIIENDAAAGASVVTVAKRVGSLARLATSAADAFGTAADGTSTYNIHCDWEVEMTTGVTDRVVGVGLGAVTSGNLTIIVCEGPYVQVRCKGDVDALVALSTLVPSSTTGTAKGFTTAGETAAEARLAFGAPYDAYSGAGANRTCRIYGNFAIGGPRNIPAN